VRNKLEARDKVIVDEALIRQCIQLEDRFAEEIAATARDEGTTGGKRFVQGDPHADLTRAKELRLSFVGVDAICNLQTLENLRVLRLDNNKISKIENLGHLVNLEWLDLSFNEITVIEGLETMRKLTDLSLFHNKISELKGLDAQKDTLECLSVGANNLTALPALVYLRTFDKLSVLNLDGNPMCKIDDYRTLSIAYVPQLKYLDFAEIDEKDYATAADHLHLMPELKDNDAARKAALADETSRKERMEALQAANIAIIDNISASLFQQEEEGVPITSFPGVSEMLGELKERLGLNVADVTEAGFRTSQEMVDDLAAVSSALHSIVLHGIDEARKLTAGYSKTVKRGLNFLKDGGSDAQVHETVRSFLVANDELKFQLMASETSLSESCERLIGEYELSVNEMMLKRAEMFSAFFRGVERAIETFRSQVVAHLYTIADKLVVAAAAAVKAKAAAKATGATPAEAAEDTVEEEYGHIDDDVKGILVDRESLNGFIASRFDEIVSRLLAFEDEIRVGEKARVARSLSGLVDAESLRNRERVSEILKLHAHNELEANKIIEEMAADDDDA